MATSFTTHSAGQVIASADINLIQTAVNTLENASGGGGDGGGPGAFQPYKAWNFDPLLLVNSSDATNPGQMYTAAVTLPKAITVTNMYMQMVTSNVSIGVLYACIYTAAGALVVQSSNTAAAYQNGANAQKVIAFPIASTALTATTYIFGFWGTGIDPLFWRGTGTADVNSGCVSPTMRAGTANTGLTNTAPGTLGTVTSQAQPFWFAIG